MAKRTTVRVTRKPTASATAILRKSVRGAPKVQAMIEQERLKLGVARQIHTARTARGLSQARLAALVGTTQSVIARLEDADYDGHSLTMLRRIAEALGYNVEVRFVDVGKAA